ncbi:hypothetical protein Ga0466249_002247 [Sporomusaceae bacterium BoRhaA]|uniref:hypothetical protein n=1 Tax=Pelorhabdus rhamnosifermentans TaxID=2772457 RepID=UPI001C0615D9|nr:hypothetical protein [Pelorhabdus rhamnosifermentans]MBU2701133.1 hypothetical protein [Pelorhabdus rhamnosifermentans]
MTVDVELYEFLKSHECHFYRDHGEVKAFVIVDFDDLTDFVKVVGTSHFDESGFEVTMRDTYICIDIDDIIDGNGEDLTAYKNCFDVDEYEEYLGKECEQS